MEDKTVSNHYQQYLKLFQMQLRGVLEDTISQSGELTGNFIKSLSIIGELRDELEKCENNENLNIKSKKVVDCLNECIVNMQFIDSIHQRIENVINGLGQTGEIWMKTQDTIDTKAWKCLDEQVKNNYKMSREREIHELFINNDTSLLEK